MDNLHRKSRGNLSETENHGKMAEKTGDFPAAFPNAPMVVEKKLWYNADKRKTGEKRLLPPRGFPRFPDGEAAKEKRNMDHFRQIAARLADRGLDAVLLTE